MGIVVGNITESNGVAIGTGEDDGDIVVGDITGSNGVVIG